ncbi:MAG: hypothetical protein IT416_00975 [Candidatus Pacebacteria bacterium]|nr:hypothetical protein [Candidatus Paceibacterota bacterium]
MKKIITLLTLLFLLFISSQPVFASKKIIDRSLADNQSLPLKNYLTLNHGQTYQKEITLTENSFGMVDLLIKMKNNVDDGIIFRIKEANQKDWAYEQFYQAEFFSHGLYYSFGFEPFTDSAGKTYLLEVEPIDNDQNNQIKLFLLSENERDWTWRAAIDQNFNTTLKQDFKKEFFEKLNNQKPFFIFWSTLLSTNLVALLVVAYKKWDNQPA